MPDGFLWIRLSPNLGHARNGTANEGLVILEATKTVTQCHVSKNMTLTLFISAVNLGLSASRHKLVVAQVVFDPKFDGSLE